MNRILIVASVSLLLAGFCSHIAASQAQWTSIGPGGVTVTSVREDPADSSILLLATSNRGFYMSTDAGERWSRRENGLPVSRINNIAQDHGEPFRIYLGTGRGVYLSFDQGESWSLASGGEMDTTAAYLVAIDPLQTFNIYAAAIGNGVFKSLDYGDLWVTSGSGLPPVTWSNITIDPNINTRAYISSTTAGFFKSVDGGDEWEQKVQGLTNQNIRSFLLDPSFSGLLFAGTTNGGFFRSTSAGESWIPQGDGLPGSSITALAILDSDQELILAGTDGDGIYSSSDGGDSFSRLGTTLIHHNVECLFTAGENRIFAGMEKDGLFMSTDGGTSWRLSNGGLGGGTISAVYPHPLQPDHIFLGLSDGENDLLVSENGGARWQLRQTGLPTFTSVNDFWLNTTSTTVFACTDSGVYASTDEGMSWSPSNTGLIETTTKIAGSTLDENSLYVIASGLYKSTDGGSTWEEAQSGIVGIPISILVSPGSLDTLYAGTKALGEEGGGVFKSIDGGASWNASSSGLPAGESIFAIDASASDPSIIFAATASGVFRSGDGGGLWFRRDTGLPVNFEGSDILIDATDPGRIFTSSLEDGVFMSTNSGESWTALNEGLSSLRVRRLAQNPAGPDSIFAATGGEGLFVIDLSPTSIEDDDPSGGNLPRTFSMSQNYPNPFNPLTTITVSIDQVSETENDRQATTLRVYDARGRLVDTIFEGLLEPGSYRFVWNGENRDGERVSSGTYFAVLRRGDEEVRRKLTLLR